jgi:hypothetical protein
MTGQSLDLRDGTLDVLGVDPDGAEEPAAVIRLEPARQQPVVHGRTDTAVE